MCILVCLYWIVRSMCRTCPVGVRMWGEKDGRQQTRRASNLSAWHQSSVVWLAGLWTNTHTQTYAHRHAWIKARIVNSLEKPTANWLCNAKRKRWDSLPRNFKGPRWDAHLLREIFYLDAIAAVAPQQHYHISRKPQIRISVVAFFSLPPFDLFLCSSSPPSRLLTHYFFHCFLKSWAWVRKIYSPCMLAIAVHIKQYKYWW